MFFCSKSMPQNFYAFQNLKDVNSYLKKGATKRDKDYSPWYSESVIPDSPVTPNRMICEKCRNVLFFQEASFS